MKKKWLSITLFALVTFGPVGSIWAQVHCYSMMSSAKSSCCCPTSQKNHCPAPVKETECPMMSQANLPDADLAPAKLIPNVYIVVVALMDVDSVKLTPSFELVKPALLSLRTDRRKSMVPPFRAPPASPIAA